MNNIVANNPIKKAFDRRDEKQFRRKYGKELFQIAYSHSDQSALNKHYYAVLISNYIDHGKVEILDCEKNAFDLAFKAMEQKGIYFDHAQFVFCREPCLHSFLNNTPPL